MERLKRMKESLIACVESQICHNLHSVDTKELGEAIDMIKDLEEAIYYHTITKAMHEEDEKQTKHHLYNKGHEGVSGDGVSYYTPYLPSMYDDMEYPTHKTTHTQEMRDRKEGTSPIHRRMYMESKEQNHDQMKKMKELEDYLQELSRDIIEMIEDASPEEKQMLRQKIAALSTKIK